MFYVPEEILRYIFCYLDYITLQKVATLVCKQWCILIRDDYILSDHLKIKIGLSVTQIENIFAKWTKLRTIELSSDIDFKFIDFSHCKWLEKIIIEQKLDCEMPTWIKVHKMWIDPKSNQEPGLENAIHLELINGSKNLQGYDCESITALMQDLEVLEISLGNEIMTCDERRNAYEALMQGLEFCQNLKTLKINYLYPYGSCIEELVAPVQRHCYNIKTIEIDFKLRDLQLAQSDSIILEEMPSLLRFKRLENLVVHGPELEWSPGLNPGNFKSTNYIQKLDLTLSYAGILLQILPICPNVKELIIDLKLLRQEWNFIVLQDLLRTIATVRKLRYLQINLFTMNENDWKAMKKEKDKTKHFLHIALKTILERFSTRTEVDINAFDSSQSFILKDRRNLEKLILKNKFEIPKLICNE